MRPQQSAGEPAGAAWPASVERVAKALKDLGVESRIVFTTDSARTAEEAAATLQVEVGQIAKSLIFRTRSSGRAVLVIAAGDHRVDEARVGALVGEPIERPNAQFVRAVTGFAIGGVPPIAHQGELIVFCDETLARFEVVWAAAGAPHAVFPIAPSELFRVTGAQVVALKED